MSYRGFPNKDTATVCAWLASEDGRKLIAEVDAGAYVESMMDAGRDRYIVDAAAEALREKLSALVLSEAPKGTLIHDMLLNALERVDWWMLEEAIKSPRG